MLGQHFDNQPARDWELERAEVETVLASELFRRAPNLSQILSYVCRQYFAGESAKIKEFNIAVEALGRGPDFDPNQDTIVRVEASRLRKRLREYYATEGAGHRIQVQLSKTGYVPQFVYMPGAETPVPAVAGETASPVQEERKSLPAAAKAVRRAFHKGAWWMVAGAVLLGILAAWVSQKSVPPGWTDASGPGTALANAEPAGEEIRILAGFTGPRFIDSLGRAWSADRYYTGGTAVEMPGAGDIHGVLDPVIYRTARRGNFRYDIPLKPGIYELRLLFAETVFGKGNRLYEGEASRVFHVSINGERRLANLDILADAGGPNIPADRVFKDISPAEDGFLHLEFQPRTSHAWLNGIEILPGIPKKMRPIRIVAGGRSYYDRAGQFWGADRYSSEAGRSLNQPWFRGPRIPNCTVTSDGGIFLTRYRFPRPAATRSRSNSRKPISERATWAGRARAAGFSTCIATGLLCCVASTSSKRPVSRIRRLTRCSAAWSRMPRAGWCFPLCPLSNTQLSGR